MDSLDRFFDVWERVLPRNFCDVLVALMLISSAQIVSAQVFGSVRVVVRDPQNLAVADAEVMVKAKGSAWSQTASTRSQGEAIFVAVPFGPGIRLSSPVTLATGTGSRENPVM